METGKLTCEDYMALVEQAPILIWRAGKDAKCDYFNERWLQFTGRTMEQEKGDGWAEGVHPEDLSRCVEFYLSNFKARTVFEMEYRLKRHDGAYRWLFDRGVPFNDPAGNFAGYIGSCIDITEKKTAQEDLKLARERELNNLRGLLPICSSCKKIKNGSGQWESVDKYIREHAEVDFSHGICPACSEKLYPGKK
ncbi:MAG TPA: PAS domain-containing protein [Elusimicrobiales bacterium]|mgnify:CR=1 FL=1|nr:PAS domain-containing protein [Elusimicrobiales bacterium]